MASKSVSLVFNAERRIFILAFLGIALFIGLGVRLFYLQVLQHGYYAEVAENQRRRAAELRPRRGTIYMAESQSTSANEPVAEFPVATNRQGWFVFAVPRDMDDPRHVAEILAPQLFAFRERQRQRSEDIITATGQRRIKAITGEATPSPTPEGESPPSQEMLIATLRDELFTRFNQRTDPYEPLLKPYEILDPEFHQWLEEQDIPGLVLEEQEVRTYPEESLAAHVLGYVGYEENGRVGRYGVEGYFEEQLAGQLGFSSAESDTQGKYIGVGARQFRPAQDGTDIVLTVDRVIQSYIEQILKDGVERYGAERGSIVVMNPRTGAVLGMATYPTFNPNTYYAIADPGVQTNPVVSDLFEPGSILKPVIMAAAIEEELVEPDTTMVDNGPVKVAEYTINTFDGKHYGVTSMTEILEQSNNVGMVWLGQQLGAETMYDYLRRFGLGERTGIDLEGETQTTVPEPDEWDITTVATTSFGQGIAMTPLQALNAINVLANRGELLQPRIVDTIRTSDGQEKKTSPRPIKQVVSPATAEKLSAMMVSVIENGVATLARVPGYYLAGKTGTAQVPDERGQYSPDRKIISFVGYGPVEDPQFSILIKLDNPAGLSFASGTAAPMFQEVAKKILQYYQIPPSYDASRPVRYQRPGSAG